jgi:hypothetical protein
MQPKKIEQYKYFQPIAWTLFLSFTGFVAIVTLQLTVDASIADSLATTVAYQ